MNFFGILYYFILPFFIFLAACTSQKVNQSSTENLYKKENNELSSKYIIYHVNDSVSQLFYEISNETLMYKRTDTSDYFYCHVKLIISVSSEDELNRVLDTTIVVVKDRQSDAIVKQLKGNVFFSLTKGINYYIDIQVRDIHKKVVYHQSEFSNKSSVYSRQNFLITNSHNELQFTSYFKPEEVVNVRSRRNFEKLYDVDFFKPNFKLALPPFSTDQMQHFSYKPDSTFSVYMVEDKIELALPPRGFYHLKTNNNTKDGVTFFVYESSFPKIKNTEQMIHATRYIMAKKEFDNCMLANDKKMAIDKFWMDIAGSNERAKELIRKYYGRVQEANKLFTSFQEGWKTDRGMIFVVFGAPNKVTKRKNGEIWTYGELGNPNSMVFAFTKIINPFTDNDYFLERSEAYKVPWYEAVDMWRQGRIYLDN
ncbi:MAG: GWxTD domain-containing protein [Bacteroidota bacterium]